MLLFFLSLTLPLLSQVEGLAEQVGVEHPRKLISFTLTGELKGLLFFFCMLERHFEICIVTVINNELEQI